MMRLTLSSTLSWSVWSTRLGVFGCSNAALSLAFARSGLHLSIAGIVYNQIRRAQLSNAEEAIWKTIQKRAEDQQGTLVRNIGTFIRNMSEIRECEVNFEQPRPGMERYDAFRALADEILEVVPSGSNQVR